MSEPIKQNQIPKAIALIFVSIGAAWLMMHSDASTLAKLNSMSATDYVQKQRELHQHSFALHFFAMLVMGGFYLGIVEFFTYVIGLVIPKKPDA